MFNRLQNKQTTLRMFLLDASKKELRAATMRYNGSSKARNPIARGFWCCHGRSIVRSQGSQTLEQLHAFVRHQRGGEQIIVFTYLSANVCSCVSQLRKLIVVCCTITQHSQYCFRAFTGCSPEYLSHMFVLFCNLPSRPSTQPPSITYRAFAHQYCTGKT